MRLFGLQRVKLSHVSSGCFCFFEFKKILLHLQEIFINGLFCVSIHHDFVENHHHLLNLLHALPVKGGAVAKEEENLTRTSCSKSIQAKNYDHKQLLKIFTITITVTITNTVTIMIIQKRRYTSRRTNSGAVMRAWVSVL